MPAAKPFRATISNTIFAIIQAGLTPGAVIVSSDGSVRVEILKQSQGFDVEIQNAKAKLLSWKDVA